MSKRRAESREDMIVTTVALPRDLHRQLVIAALDDGAASAEVIRQAVREYLERRAKQRRR